MREKFILIDGNSLANRAFYAIPMLSNSQGFITNAIYGFCNMLWKIIGDEKPAYMAVAFDKGRMVFRHQDYEEYKAQRKATPDELRPQFPVLKKLLTAMRIAVFEMDGYEADDIIGTLVKWGEKQDWQNLIVTGDRDALQLISAQTTVLLTKKGITELERYDEEAVQNKYGVEPLQMIDVKGFMGDASDNIPGIPGVGEKTALKLIQEYGNVENALAHRGDFQGKKLGLLMEEHGDLAILSKKLATIDCCMPLDIEQERLKMIEPDYPQVIELLKELEFKNLLQNMMERMNQSGHSYSPAVTLETGGQTVEDPGLLKDYLGDNPASLILLVETGKTGTRAPEIKGITLKMAAEDAPDKEPLKLHWKSTAQRGEFLLILQSYLESEKVAKTLHDSKTAELALQAHGILLRGVVNDTMLMAYLLNPSRSQNDLPTIIGDYLEVSLPGKEGAELSFAYVKAMEMLVPRFYRELLEKDMWELYRDVELPLSQVLARMETTGVLLDQNILEEMGDELNGRISALTEEIYRLAGEEFNINSPKQLGYILFEKLGLARGKKTKTGYSTSAEVLEALALEHEIVAQILLYRQLVKLKTTYIDGLIAIRDPQTSRVYTSFNQAVTATGRLSSTEPNLQNIPIRMEEGRRIRKAFLASPGQLLLAADYSQIELRVLAHLAQDELLLEAFQLDQDIHTRTASEVFGVPMEAVSKDLRRAAKAVNFGIIYGISDFGLSKDLGISRREAKDYIDNYFHRYHGVKAFIDKTIAEAREKGYVTTIMNRRRYLPDILSRNFHLRSFAERTAMNTPIQGSAADIIKLAMLKTFEAMQKTESGSAMLLQVHDELIFDVPREHIIEMGKLVNKTMSGAYPLSVPLKVDLQVGTNWYDMLPLELNKR